MKTKNLKGSRIAVYCASSAKTDQRYLDQAAELAKEFVRKGVKLVFGGGKTGLMGHTASIVIENGGQVQGVMPYFLKNIDLLKCQDKAISVGEGSNLEIKKFTITKSNIGIASNLIAITISYI